ncbi:MAG: DUF4827 domain-containing protein [[Clostridium] fimetarium]|nr:DUF4827 domain-containing protein [Alistipes timonensis]MCM1404982.1 DUF4827 domain-containing protein [[Clostridium] fimetarium]
MYRKLLCLIAIPILLAACRSEEDPYDFGLFHLTLGMEADAEVGMGTHDAEVTINGYPKEITVGVVGTYNSISISDDVPLWMHVTASDKGFIINVAELTDNETRRGEVRFTVSKGNEKQAGVIKIVQNPLTLEDLKKTERRAIKTYLRKFDVVETLPALSEIQVGSVAPFYKLDADGDVYMQVVRMGTALSATDGDRVYFRYLRYDLLYYLKNGALPPGQGNMNDITQDVTSFVVGSDQEPTLRWGRAIQMPMLLGLPSDSEVNLIVASEAGITAEISSVTPYLYNIRYLQADK